MKKNYFVIFVLFIILSPLYANNDASLYIDGLEFMVDENDSQAIESFNDLIDLYPTSKYNVKANDYLFNLNNKKDNSGLVPFYLNNIGTFTYTAFGLGELFELPSDTLSIGITGLAGVGGGLGISSLLSKEFEITSELYSRIATTQTVSMGNYFYLLGVLYEEDILGSNQYDDKISLASQLATLNGSLYLSYFGLRNKELEKGKGFFGFQSYAWANYYYWLTAIMFEMEFNTTELLLGMGISDLVYFGSQPLWDNLQWSSTRSGLISVGGIGGALVGVFSDLILENFIDLDAKLTTGIIMGTTLAGQIYTTYLTRNMDSNKKHGLAKTNSIMPYPIIKANKEIGIGFHSFI